MTSFEAKNRVMSRASDRKAVAREVRAAGSSFYWAMRLMKEDRRAALFAIYGFCREVDDIADGTLPAEEKMQGLAEWRARIDALYGHGEIKDDPLDRALLDGIARYGLEQTDFDAVIRGMEMDAMGPICAPSMDLLYDYCDCVASAVGRLCVEVFGAPDEAGRSLADHLGKALQLTNIIRDVEEDATMGRLYLPRPVLEEAGIDASLPPVKVIEEPGLAVARQILSKKAETEFEAAKLALARCDSGDMRPAIIMMTVYERVYARMKANEFSPETKGTVSRMAGRLEKLWIAGVTAVKGRP